MVIKFDLFLKLSLVLIHSIVFLSTRENPAGRGLDGASPKQGIRETSWPFLVTMPVSLSRM